MATTGLLPLKIYMAFELIYFRWNMVTSAVCGANIQVLLPVYYQNKPKLSVSLISVLFIIWGSACIFWPTSLFSWVQQKVHLKTTLIQGKTWSRLRNGSPNRQRVLWLIYQQTTHWTPRTVKLVVWPEKPHYLYLFTNETVIFSFRQRASRH